MSFYESNCFTAQLYIWHVNSFNGFFGKSPVLVEAQFKFRLVVEFESIIVKKYNFGSINKYIARAFCNVIPLFIQQSSEYKGCHIYACIFINAHITEYARKIGKVHLITPQAILMSVITPFYNLSSQPIQAFNGVIIPCIIHSKIPAHVIIFTGVHLFSQQYGIISPFIIYGLRI